MREGGEAVRPLAKEAIDSAATHLREALKYLEKDDPHFERLSRMYEELIVIKHLITNR